MGREHEAETVWQAQELYCSDRLPYLRVAELTGVADSTLRRWAETYGWRDKREAIAKAEADIRADKILARSVMLQTLIKTRDAQTGFAVSALETLALKEAEAARHSAARAMAEAAPSLAIATPADAIAALRKAVEQKLSALLTRPEAVDLKAVTDVQKCLALIGDMERALPANEGEEAARGGITDAMHQRLVDALTRGA